MCIMSKSYSVDEVEDRREMRKSLLNFKGRSMRKTEERKAIKDSFERCAG